MVIEDNPDPADVEFLAERINEFNADLTGYHDGLELAIFDRDAAGVITAGIYGFSWGGYAEIEKLWIHESRRRSGRGTELMSEFEAEARRRGCDRIIVGTHSFQAPDFYQRLGYRIVADVEGKPRGYSHFDLVKVLDGQGLAVTDRT